MLIRLTKTRDGCLLTIVRSDGSASSQRTGHAGFFALHDISHYCVETELSLENAFFGLLNKNWDISTFENKADPRYQQVPQVAIAVEHIVEVLCRRAFEQEQSDPQLRSLWCDEVLQEIALSATATKSQVPTITHAQLLCICGRMARLYADWKALDVGSSVELLFPAVVHQQ